MLRAGVVVVVALATALAACGDDDDEGGARDPYEERSGLESSDVLDVVCEHWESGSQDHLTVTQYVRDLLLPLDMVNQGTPFTYTFDDIDVSVVAACKAHRDDPATFLRAVRDDLGLSQGSLDGLIDSACARYREQQSRIADGNWSGEDIATFIRDLASGGGASLEDLRRAVDGMCAD